MNEFYNEIMDLKGFDSFKKMIKKWETLSNNLQTSKAGNINILPDLLWVSKRGINKSELLHLLAGYLIGTGNLMKFYGEHKYIEFHLAYFGNEDRDFSELNRFINNLNNAAGFRNEFKGIVYIDISEWVDHLSSRNFTDFMEYLATNTVDWLVILNIDEDDNKKIDEVESTLSVYLRIEKLKIDLPKTKDLVDYAVELLAGYDFFVDESGQNLLKESIDLMRKSKFFDGFNSINHLCSDIIYASLSVRSGYAFVLNSENMADFSPDSPYVKRIIANFEKRRNVIGF